MRYLIASMACALMLVACGTLNPNISSADGTFIGIGGKANPDGTAEGAIGYGNFGVQVVPAIDKNQKPITVVGKCGEQHELSAVIVTNNGATGGVGASGINNAFTAGAVIATGRAAEGIAHASEVQAWRGVTVAGAVNTSVQPGGAIVGQMPSSALDEVGQNGLAGCAR